MLEYENKKLLPCGGTLKLILTEDNYEESLVFKWFERKKAKNSQEIELDLHSILMQGHGEIAMCMLQEFKEEYANSTLIETENYKAIFTEDGELVSLRGSDNAYEIDYLEAYEWMECISELYKAIKGL